MKYLQLPNSQQWQLPLFLAAEEWAARHCSGELFFMWQVDPTVICGRNQIIDLEVNLNYCHDNGIEVYRRKSGGGCVFADRSNIMFSYITDATEVTATFAGYTDSVATMLRSLGLDASANTRNDVLIANRKVSGNAFYNIPEIKRCIVHGTMLYDTDLCHITNAITPSRAKLISKGVTSTASRITTIKEHLPSLTIDRFKAHARASLCGSDTLVATPEDIKTIKNIAKPLFTDSWIYRKTAKATLQRRLHIEGCGEFIADIDLTDGNISWINLSGDFFMLSDIDSTILSHLINVPYKRQAIKQALKDIKTSETIPSLTNDSFINLLI